MTNEERTKCRIALRELCDRTEATKNADYSTPEDTLSNFKEMASFTGTTKYQAWLVYFGKHLHAIINSIRKSPEFPQVESEPIKGRIVDAIVYLQILDALIEEDKANKPKVIRAKKPVVAAAPPPEEAPGEEQLIASSNGEVRSVHNGEVHANDQ